MASITSLNSKAIIITNEERARSQMVLQIWEWTSSRLGPEILSCFIMEPKLHRSAQLMALSKNHTEGICQFKTKHNKEANLLLWSRKNNIITLLIAQIHW